MGTIGTPTVSQAQLLLPFPQYTSVNLVADYAASSYNAMALQGTKRVNNSITVSANFTWARNTDSEYGLGSVGPQNYYNLKAEWSQSSLDIPFRYTANVDYWLPVGRGRRFLGHVNRWADLAVGGWQVDFTNQAQSGVPMGFTQSNQNALLGTGVQRPNLVSGVAIKAAGTTQQRLLAYLNPAAFSLAPALTFGNAPRRVSDRTFGRVDLDASIQKSFKFVEGISFQFRAEATNVLNLVDFGAPGTVVGSTTFGTITSAANSPRYVKLGGHLTF